MPQVHTGKSVPALSLATPQVQFGNTVVVGRSSVPALPVEFFGGIPFAEPPTELLRFNAPVLKTSLAPGAFNATNFGKSCLQQDMSTDLMSEDCLTVNIFRPAGVLSDASLPVVSTIQYGGGFADGGSAPYNASIIVAQSVARGTPIIYVSFNYRLGPLGFSQGSEAFRSGILNLGLRDQLTCLEWVQSSIGAFGGDPSKVTLFGESAGAIMTALLFLGDTVTNLARAAIFESGSAASSAIFTADRGERDWQNFVGGVPPCSELRNTSETLDCLRMATDSADLLTGWAAASSQAEDLFPWSPTIDGTLIPTLPSIMWSNGNFSRIPFIAGTNLDEGTAFTGNYPFTDTLIYDFIIANFSPPFMTNSPSDLDNAAKELLQLYPDDPAAGSPFNTGNETFGLPAQYKRVAAIEGDISFQSQRRLWTQTAAASGVRVFSYLFTQPQAVLPWLGVYHSSEVRFVYGDVGPLGSSNGDLSRMMIDYWLSFATSLDPNDRFGIARPLWSPYTSQNQVGDPGSTTMTMIPDDYRKSASEYLSCTGPSLPALTDEIEYIMSISQILHH
ncbi:esterase 1 [Mycena galericulata]|nr:esterase 1 [Mycena galericulata]